MHHSKPPEFYSSGFSLWPPSKSKVTLHLLTIVVVQSLIHVWLFVTPWTAACHASLSFTTSQSLLSPLSWWCHPTISSSAAFFSSCPQSFPASGSFPVSQLLHQVAKVLEPQFQHQSFQWIFRVDFLQDWLIWYPCCPRDTQEFPPAPQFESINYRECSNSMKARSTLKQILSPFATHP